MKAAIVALSAMIGMTACNREAKEGQPGAEKSQPGAQTSQTDAQTDKTGSAGKKIEEEARQTGRDIGEATDKAVSKTEEEARQTSRDVGEATDKAVSKTEEEARQSSRDAGEGADKTKQAVSKEAAALAAAAAKPMPGDVAVTKTDKQLLANIRRSLASDRDVTTESKDVRIKVDNGQVGLEGTVTSKKIKDEIARITKGAAGETKVKDNVKVAEQVGTGNTDQ